MPGYEVRGRPVTGCGAETDAPGPRLLGFTVWRGRDWLSVAVGGVTLLSPAGDDLYVDPDDVALLVSLLSHDPSRAIPVLVGIYREAAGRHAPKSRETRSLRLDRRRRLFILPTNLDPGGFYARPSRPTSAGPVPSRKS